MKKILGSLFIATLLFAQNYTLHLSKREAFVKEPILLDLRYTTTHKSNIAWIKFHPKKSSDYEAHLLEKKELTDGFANRYLIFPLHPGKLTIPLILQIKWASLEDLENAVLGTGYEQTKEVEGRIVHYKIAPLHILAKPVKDVELFGSYHIQESVSANKAKAYEPIYLDIDLRGQGYPPKLSHLLPSILDVKILADHPDKKISWHEDGAHIHYHYRYALIAKHDFTIPAITLENFDYHSYKELRLPPKYIKILPAPIKPDATNNPPKLEPIANDIGRWVGYGAIFLAGLLTGVLLFVLLKKRFELQQRVLLADQKELLKILALYFPDEFMQEKEELSVAIQQKRKINLTKIKKEVIHALSKNKR